MMNGYGDLFDDLSGWRMAGAGGFRVVSEGVIESFGGSGLYWFAGAAFGDFLLTVDWRITNPDDNSGVFLRSPPLEDSPGPAIEQGYEVQIDDRGLDPQRGVLGSPLHLTGAIYKQAPASRLASRAVGEWNSFEVSALGSTIVVRLNGVEVSRLEQATRTPRGHICLQNHHEGSAVQFRKLRIMPPGE